MNRSAPKWIIHALIGSAIAATVALSWLLAVRV